MAGAKWTPSNVENEVRPGTHGGGAQRRYTKTGRAWAANLLVLPHRTGCGTRTGRTDFPQNHAASPQYYHGGCRGRLIPRPDRIGILAVSRRYLDPSP